jgi:ATP-dependent DNA helicase RecG
MSVTRIRELAKQERVSLHWDEKVCERATFSDLDEEKVRWFLRQARRERNLDIDPDIPIQEALERLELTRNGLVTNAAVLLFGKRPQRFFITSEIRCGRFKGAEPLEFIDMKVQNGNLIDQRENAVKFVLDHLPRYTRNMIQLHAKIVGLERIETWEYPTEAIREAITNAVVHRDYEMPANVQVRIFDDRLEVWGCGSLLPPLTVENLKGKHRFATLHSQHAVLRNPLIGNCFFLIKFIEQWGTGTNRIIEACVSHDLPEPTFEEISGGLVACLEPESEAT